ncbi:MAG TPA: formate dehydrogenase accessory protein FdhE [Candidatus Binatia bacterium]|nr:formate dehydrogenase accessory protein FdhE [Candidatus Binatia bacterium]
MDSLESEEILVRPVAGVNGGNRRKFRLRFPPGARNRFLHSKRRLPSLCVARHNRRVTRNTWRGRIARAGQLAEQYPFASEILGFYSHIAHFQAELGGGGDGSVRWPPDAEATVRVLVEYVPKFQAFLLVVERHGPALLAQVARMLQAGAPDWQADVLREGWLSTQPPSQPQGFLAYAFLQPYAELQRQHAGLQTTGYQYSYCPFCNRKPAFGIMRPQGDGASRHLACGFCLTEWEFRRVTCPGCGEEDPDKLPVYTAAELPHVRVECCDTCKTYIKSIDLTKNGLAVPLVDEMASVPLNLWAQEHTYAKLFPNLLGM